MMNFWRNRSVQSKVIIFCSAWILWSVGFLVPSWTGAPDSAQGTSGAGLWFFCAGIGLTGFMYFTFRQSVTRPLQQLAEFARIVAEGHLGERLDMQQKNEIGLVAERFNRIMESFELSEVDSNRKVGYLDSIPTPVMVVDRDYAITYMNPAGARLANKTPEQVKGKKCFDIFKTAHCNTPECRCRQAMSMNGVFTAETVAKPLKESIPIQYSSAPIKDEKGKIIGALEYILDISKQKGVQHGVKGSVNDLTLLVEEVSSVLKDLDQKSKAITDQTHSVAGAAEKMSSTMASVSSIAEESQNNINAVASATEEMTSTVGEIAQNSEKARIVTENAVQSVAGASERVNELGTAAKEISKVIETIVEIAEQTKLLALNAT
ncbi:MAG: PAS domain-containing protein, partial [Planctomycetota bacterium]